MARYEITPKGNLYLSITTLRQLRIAKDSPEKLGDSGRELLKEGIRNGFIRDDIISYFVSTSGFEIEDILRSIRRNAYQADIIDQSERNLIGILQEMGLVKVD